MTDFLILAADAKESHRLQDEHWIHSRNVTTVKALHRGVLMGANGKDVFYTDAALDALVRSAGDDGPTVTGAAIYLQADRAWRAWRRARPGLARVLPFEAWLYLHEDTLESIAARPLDVPHPQVLRADQIISRAQLVGAWDALGLINHTRAATAAAVRAAAKDRRIRIAPGRVVVKDFVDPDGHAHVSAQWSALPAARREVPRWMLNGLDLASSVAVQ